jgi:TPR repeat protein
VDYLEGIQKNFDEAAKVLKFNCEENKHSDSCYKLGAYYVTGKGKEGLPAFFVLADISAGITPEPHVELSSRKDPYMH